MDKEFTQEEQMFLINDFECVDEHFEIYLEKEDKSAEIQGDPETNEFYISMDDNEFEEELESSEALSKRLGEAISELLENGWKIERAPFLAAGIWSSNQWKLIDFNKLYCASDADFTGTPDEQFDKYKN